MVKEDTYIHKKDDTTTFNVDIDMNDAEAV